MLSGGTFLKSSFQAIYIKISNSEFDKINKIK